VSEAALAEGGDPAARFTGEPFAPPARMPPLWIGLSSAMMRCWTASSVFSQIVANPFLMFFRHFLI